MKTTFNSILEKAVVGKKIAKQDGVRECNWGNVITRIVPCSLLPDDKTGYCIYTDNIFYPCFTIAGDFVIELEE